MRSKEDIQSAIAQILRELRRSAALTQAEIAETLGIDEKTYARYERGESSPPLVSFVQMLDAFGTPALPVIKKYLYPDRFGEDSVQVLRRHLAEYMMQYASDKEIKRIDYLVEGQHGSPLEAQIQLFCAFDHLPMDARLIAAKVVFQLWELETARGGIINSADPMPDIELLRSSLIRATEAVIAGRNSYSSIIK